MPMLDQSANLKSKGVHRFIAGFGALRGLCLVPLEHTGDVGLLEVFSLKEERFRRCFRQCIGKAVSKIQSRRMTPLAEVEESLTSEMRLLQRDRFNENASAAKKRITLASGVRSDLSLDHYR